MIEDLLKQVYSQNSLDLSKTIKLHKTSYGSAYTILYTIDKLKEEQYDVCLKNRLFVIGNGLNGDLLTINLNNLNVGYVFHSDLIEENYSTIDDIYIELPFSIDEFLKIAISTMDYPFDGTRAEIYLEQNK